MLGCCSGHAGLVYSTILSPLGGSDASVTAMAVDAAGNVYLTGVTSDAAFPSTPGVIQPQFGGGVCTYGILGPGPLVPQQYFTCTDAFVMKLDSSGSVVFATFLGGSGEDRATSISVDGAGNIYVAGISGSANFPRVPGSAFEGPGPAFVVKLDASGTTLLYSAFLPGTGDLPFLAPFQSNVPSPSLKIVMATDAEGNAWFAANASSGFPVTSGALASSGPMVVGKLDPSGSRITYGTYFGGTGFNSVGGIVLDGAGAVYLTGKTCSSDFPVTPGASQAALPDHDCAGFVSKFDPYGSGLIYSTYIGGGSYAYPSQIHVDAAGNAYVLGVAQGSQFPVTDGAFQSTWVPGSAFLMKLSADGTAVVYATNLYFPGAPAMALDVDPEGNAYVAGQTTAVFPASADAFQASYAGGGDDVFIARFAPDGSLSAGTYLGGTSYESAFAIAAVSDGSVVVCGTTNSVDFPATAGRGPGYFVSRLSIAGSPNQ
jgi:hypothetical protein